MATPNLLGQTQDLAPYAAPYVTGMLGKGQAISNMPFTAYQGPLTAGQSDLQTQAYQGLGALTTPTAQMGGFTPTSFTSGATAQNYMSPYLQGALQPQYDAARRQADIAQEELQSRYGKAGAYGGSRQGIAEAELQRGLLDRMAGITGAGYQDAFQQAQNQFNTEQGYGLRALAAQQAGGAQQRVMDQEAVMADIAQFETERDDPFRKTQYMQSLLQGLPISTQSYQYAAPTNLQSFSGGAGTVLDLLERFDFI